VLILPPGHGQAVANPRRLGRRERWIVSGVAGVSAALLIVAIVAFTSGTAKVGRGCINVMVQSSLGGQPFAGCGSKARTMCAAVNAPGGYIGVVGDALAAACRKQGIKVG
jgi:hypothetical protein